MGVTWGVAREEAWDHEALARWTAVCANGICPRFSIPFDETMFTFTRDASGAANVSQSDASPFRRAMKRIPTGDGGREEFAQLFDGYCLFFPDELGLRRIPRELFPDHDPGHSLSVLLALHPSQGKLASELRALAVLCALHGAVLQVNFA